MRFLLLILLLPLSCISQTLPTKATTFMAQEATNGYRMRGTDIQIAFHDVLQLSFNCIDLGVTCTNLTTSLADAYPFIGNTLISQSLNLFNPASDALVFTGSPTVNDGYLGFNGTTQYGTLSISGSSLPTGTVAMSMCIFFQMPSNVDGMMFQIGLNTGTATRFGIFFQSGNLIAEASNERATANWTYDNHWHFIVITHPASGIPTTFKIYLDGSAMTINSTAGTTAVNIGSTGSLSVAKIPNTLSSLYTGNLKFPIIWGREISSTEVTQLWNALKYLVGL